MFSGGGGIQQFVLCLDSSFCVITLTLMTKILRRHTQFLVSTLAFFLFLFSNCVKVKNDLTIELTTSHFGLLLIFSKLQERKKSLKLKNIVT